MCGCLSVSSAGLGGVKVETARWEIRRNAVARRVVVWGGGEKVGWLCVARS